MSTLTDLRLRQRPAAASGMRRGSTLRAVSRASSLVFAVLAVLTLILSIPQHVMDTDDDGAVPAGITMIAHAGPPTVIDHHGPGHLCADHCAAHVLGDVPHHLAIAAMMAVSTDWQVSTVALSASLSGAPPKPPPRA